MIYNILLAPYYGILKLRHLLYDKGIKKSEPSPIPSVCIGNVTVGGTGKTPHTEMILRELALLPEMKGRNIAVLSGGYKRKSRGFQQVTADGSACEYGDEPLQIKKKFPDTTVAVCKSRVEGCRILGKPESIMEYKSGKKCKNPGFRKADAVILDDAFQHRALVPDISIVLADFNNPVYQDHLLPAGKLRDLPGRIQDADIIIVTKCPPYIEDDDKRQMAGKLRLEDYNTADCTCKAPNGKKQLLMFTTLQYDEPAPVFPEGDPRYSYSSRAILLTGIANPVPLARHLSDSYNIVRHISFGDHHSFSKADINSIARISGTCPTAAVITTEKDSQRLYDCKEMPETLKKKLIKIPVRAVFSNQTERNIFVRKIKETILSRPTVH